MEFFISKVDVPFWQLSLWIEVMKKKSGILCTPHGIGRGTEVRDIKQLSTVRIYTLFRGVSQSHLLILLDIFVENKKFYAISIVNWIQMLRRSDPSCFCNCLLYCLSNLMFTFSHPLLLVLLLLSVPGSSPEHIEATLLNATAVYLKWRPPPNDTINGECWQ